nr:DUF1365 domain-containing protein [Marinobacter fonticola]
MNSQWLSGRIRHRRLHPVRHAFEYDTGMLALDLDEWSSVGTVSRWFSVERMNWLSLKRRDYFQPGEDDLKAAIGKRVEQATGWRPDGRIELITHPRYLGHIFNPVSFYCCYSAGDDPARGVPPRVIAAQITNTPWHERHLYVLESGPVETSRAGWTHQRFQFGKRFHVSPYNPMDQDYQWLFCFRGSELRIHMNVIRDGAKVFDATLEVQRTPLTRKSVRQHIRRFPLETVKVAGGIYWHALKLKLKGAALQDHPDKLDNRDPAYRRGHEDQGKRVDTASPRSGKVSSWRT